MTRNRVRTKRRQRGSAAIVAAAIIVIVGFLGAAMMSSVRVHTTATVNYIQGTQAYYIADAGVEWACMEDSATSGPVSFSSGSFEVAADGDNWVVTAESGDTRCAMECDAQEQTGAVPTGLCYVLGSREEDDPEEVEFFVMNASSSDITFDTLKVTWDSPTAFFEDLEIEIVDGIDYDVVWDHEDEPGNYQWGSGETKDFTRVSSVTIPAHCLAEFDLEEFEESATGGSDRDMRNTEVTIEFYDGTTLVGEITVELAPN